MSELLHSDVTAKVIGAAYEVHGALGPGFLESAYEEAVAHELALLGVPFRKQVRVPVYYKKVQVDLHVLDLVVADKVVVELKAVTELTDIHRAIVHAYLAATKLQVALLINFGKPQMEFRRIIRSRASTR